MDNNSEFNLNSSVSGKYLIEIIKRDGSIVRPFGSNPLNNLVLDTFFDSILQNGYAFGVQAFVQSCRIGGGAGSDTPVDRTQTGLRGTQVGISHIGDAFTATPSSSTTSSILLQRDFKFDNTTATPIVCREAIVGCFGSSVGGMDITVSRFVFPNDIIINSGEQLRITYSFNIVLEFLYKNIPVTMSCNGVDLTGNLRLTSSDAGLRSANPSAGTTYIQQGNSSTYYLRDWKNTNSATFSSSTVNNTDYGTYSNIFGIANNSDKIGFFDGSHAVVTYPTARPSFTNLGPLSTSASILNYIKADTYASVDKNYYMLPSTTSRTAGGIYLSYNTYAFSYTAIYLRFTESNFTTNRSAIIPASVPIAFKIRYIFSR